MAKTDWTLHDTVQPEDMNALGEEMNQLRKEVGQIEIPSASLSKQGIVQLSNQTDSVADNLAATPKAVKAAYDRANEAFQAGNDRKAEVVAALVAKGVSASTSDSWELLIDKIKGIIKATGNATNADVLNGKTFSNASVNGQTGTMNNHGAKIFTPGTTNIAIPAGYHNGNGYILGDPKLVSGNLPKDINLFGVQGLLERMTTSERNKIVSAISAKGVPAKAEDSNEILAQKISQIVTGVNFWDTAPWKTTTITGRYSKSLSPGGNESLLIGKLPVDFSILYFSSISVALLQASLSFGGSARMGIYLKIGNVTIATTNAYDTSHSWRTTNLRGLSIFRSGNNLNIQAFFERKMESGSGYTDFPAGIVSQKIQCPRGSELNVEFNVVNDLSSSAEFYGEINAICSYV